MPDHRVGVRACLLGLLVLAAGEFRAAAAGTLRTVTTAADSATDPPVGSLRQILEDVAQPGDSIQFAQNFSIHVDPEFRIRVPVALTGITIQGPAELRGGVFEVFGDGCTVSGMRFADCHVFGGGAVNFDDDSRTDGFSFHDNVLVGDASLQLVLTADALVEDNTFDVRDPKGDNAVGDFYSDRPHWSHNTWPATSVGGFTEANSTGLLFDGGNTVFGNATFQARSGRIEGNDVKGHMRAYRSDADQDGPLVIEGNTCGSLGAHRPDLEVLGNTVTGNPLDMAKSVKIAKLVRDPESGEVVPKVEKEQRAIALTAGMTGAAGDAGYVRVEGNTVTATAGWNAGMVVDGTDESTECTVAGNTVTGGKLLGLAVHVTKSATVTTNTVNTGGKKGALVLDGPAADGFEAQGNVVNGGTGPGIVVGPGVGTAHLDFNLAQSCKTVGLQVSGRALVSEDGDYKGCAVGVRVMKSTKATITGGSITGNKGSGLLCDPFSVVEVAQVAFGGNGGAGIDLAPGGVTVNTKKKSANGNMPYPETLEYDPATGKAKGVSEPFARIDAYAVEEGERKGNPKNGEGVSWMGEVFAGADGRFTFPASGRIACPPSHRVTFTATRQGEGLDPVTSEFSLDVDCSGAALVLVDRNLAGGPGNGQVNGNAALNDRQRTISEDGRFVAFLSSATDLVEGDTNDAIDVFVRDTAAGTTERVSLTPAGGQITYVGSNQGDVGSAPSISADGRFVCYTSRAEGAFTDGTWYYNYPGAILYDRETGTSTIVADPRNLEAPLPNGDYTNYGAYYASVSGDGSAVIFTSLGRNYAGTDVGDDVDVFVWTRASGAYERVSVPTGGGDPTNGFQAGAVLSPRLSHDARFAVFASPQILSPGLAAGMRTWLRDRQAGTTEAVCIDSAGAIRTGYDPWPSDDGRYVAFYSYESLVPEDTNGYVDVYLRDRQAGTTTLVSAKDDGMAMYGDSLEPTMSGDGRYVLFRNFGDVWLWDRTTGTKVNVSGSPTVYPNVGCASPRLSRTAQFVQYQTYATNLVDLGGQTFVTHVFLRDLSVME